MGAKELWDQWHDEWNKCSGRQVGDDHRVCSSRPDVDGQRWVDLAWTPRGRNFMAWTVRDSTQPKPPLNLYLAAMALMHFAPSTVPNPFEEVA
jgi:hypothetical protein